MQQLHKNKKPTLTEFDSYIEHYRKNLDKHCAPTGESTAYFNQLKAQKLQEWLARYHIKHPNSILDFGCGDGAMTYEVKKIFPETSIFGVDPSPESITTAQENYSLISFNTSSETIPFKDASFEVIYTAGVLHHIPFDMHTHYIQECMRVLKPGGFLIIFELNPINPGTRYIFNRNPIDQNATMLTPWYTKKITQNFTYKETIFYCFFPHFLRFLRPLEAWLTAIPFGGLYGTIVKKTF